MSDLNYKHWHLTTQHLSEVSQYGHALPWPLLLLVMPSKLMIDDLRLTFIAVVNILKQLIVGPMCAVYCSRMPSYITEQSTWCVGLFVKDSPELTGFVSALLWGPVLRSPFR